MEVVWRGSLRIFYQKTASGTERGPSFPLSPVLSALHCELLFCVFTKCVFDEWDLWFSSVMLKNNTHNMQPLENKSLYRKLFLCRGNCIKNKKSMTSSFLDQVCFYKSFKVPIKEYFYC